MIYFILGVLFGQLSPVDQSFRIEWNGPIELYSKFEAPIVTPSDKRLKIPIINNIIPSILKETSDEIKLDYTHGWIFEEKHVGKTFKYNLYGAHGIANCNDITPADAGFKLPISLAELPSFERPIIKSGFDSLEPPPLE